MKILRRRVKGRRSVVIVFVVLPRLSLSCLAASRSWLAGWLRHKAEGARLGAAKHEPGRGRQYV